jgi:zinc and cadmium transporter
LIFFSIEKFFRWQHCHDPECADSDHQHVVAINLLGDTIHNFVDGLLVAASFSVSAQVGFATAISVFIHEVPQELGHFGILLHQGVSLKKSILYNFLSAMSSFLGVAVIFTLKSSVALLPSFILPITAGGFIYLASSDLIPELHRQQPFLKDSVVQILCIIAGIILMLSLLAIG